MTHPLLTESIQNKENQGGSRACHEDKIEETYNHVEIEEPLPSRQF